MSDSPDLALVRRLYDSKMAPEVAREIMAPDLVWDITPGFPNSGVHHGWDNVAKDFFGKMTGYESFGAVPEEFYADGAGHVVVYGHYHAETTTGNKADVRFIHLWTVRDGKLAERRQTADSHILQEARLRPEPRRPQRHDRRAPWRRRPRSHVLRHGGGLGPVRQRGTRRRSPRPAA